MNYILSDGNHREALLPFTYTRPIADIRFGILTIRDKWEAFLGKKTSSLSEPYLEKKYPLRCEEQNVVIAASYLPNAELVKIVQELHLGEAVLCEGEVVAYATTNPKQNFSLSDYKSVAYNGVGLTIKHTWDIFAKNAEALQADYDLLTKGRKSQPISETNTVIEPDNIFLEEGAKVECSILNASTGPIYIGKNAEIMEGCVIRGGLALCDNATLKMGAKIYGASTFGPHCKAGGEINNAVLFAYSNKGHDGFLGNSVLGEWCNIGADSNTSNLKNNYAEVKLWDYKTEGFAKTGLQFCGLMMGDHSKCGINTMFNTGTVVGVSANIFGSNFPRNFVPSFSWGGAAGFTNYLPRKAFETAKAMMDRRGVDFDQTEQDILQEVHDMTKRWRRE
ncbi:MAG: GlmU family protein [Croceitalea sp.]|nr:GlmU family protein [Croceitalea sp.]NNC35061.1 glucose-1-phosphate thymidylyltransferase [Croceitalea sp.]